MLEGDLQPVRPLLLRSPSSDLQKTKRNETKRKKTKQKNTQVKERKNVCIQSTETAEQKDRLPDTLLSWPSHPTMRDKGKVFTPRTHSSRQRSRTPHAHTAVSRSKYSLRFKYICVFDVF